MKPLKKYLLLSLIAPLLFSLLAFTNAIASNETVIVKVYEADKRYSSYMAKIIISESGKLREIPLEHGFQSPEANKNLETVAMLINQYTKGGYKIEHFTATTIGQNNAHSVTTYILTK